MVGYPEKLVEKYYPEILEEIKPLVEAKGYEVVSGANTQCEKYLRDTLKSVFRKI